MPYVRETCVAGDVIEISKYYSYRAHTKGEKRSPKKIPSSMAQKRANDRKAERDLRRLMNANFKRGDYLLRLDFYEHKPKDSKEMQEMTAKAVRKSIKSATIATKRFINLKKAFYVGDYRASSNWCRKRTSFSK